MRVQLSDGIETACTHSREYDSKALTLSPQFSLGSCAMNSILRVVGRLASSLQLYFPAFPLSYPCVLSGKTRLSCHHPNVRLIFPLSYSPSCLFTRTNETLGINVSFRFYRGALGALLLYDVTESSSISNIKTWVEELRHYTSPHIITMLVGNKTDLGALTRCPHRSSRGVFASAFRPDILWLNSVAKSLRALPYHRSYRGKRHDVYGDLSTQHVQRRDCV